MKVTPGEEIKSQHCLQLMDMFFKKKVRKKVKFLKEIETVVVERVRNEKRAC